MPQLFLNYAHAQLDSAIDDNQTTLSIASATNLPTSLSSGDWFLLTIFKNASSFGENIEVVRVTAINSSVYTVDRGQGGTSPVGHEAGESIEAHFTAESFTENAIIHVRQIPGQPVPSRPEAAVVFWFTWDEPPTSQEFIYDQWFQIPEPAIVTPQEPAPPFDLKAVAGDASVQLTWKASPSTGSSAPQGYRVYRNTNNDSSSASQIGSDLGASATSFQDNNVTNGSTYWYWVTAYNAEGESSFSNSTTATPGTISSYEGLVAALAPIRRWSMNETGGSLAADDSGQSNFSLDGSFDLNAPGATAELGSGVLFTNGWANAPLGNSDLETPNALTVAVWIEFHDLNTDFATILAKNDTDGSTSTLDWGMALRDNANAQFRVKDTTSTSNTNQFQALTSTLSLNTTYLLIGEWQNGGPTRIYVNGNTLEGTSINTTISTVVNQYTQLHLGGVPNNTSRRLNATISDAMVFNRLLSGSEKDDLWNAGAPNS